jgi:PelA/Pel-15E family pectate lyase
MNRSFLNVMKNLEKTVVKNLQKNHVFFELLVALFIAAQTPTAIGEVRWGEAILRQQPHWYNSAEARAVADSVIQYQSPQGGWPKSANLATPPRTPDDIPPPGRGRANSLDNEATTLPIAFLARMVHVTGESKYRDSFLSGVDYLLAAQYTNGGWPQFWPLRDGYYSRITYNDGAMIRVMTILRDVAGGQPPYDFVDSPRRGRATDVVARGIDCILKTQIKQDGKRTAWCAQHDEKTLEPAWARAYEPPSLSGAESVGIIRFLMSIEEPTPEIVAAIEGAVAWFRSVAMKSVRLESIHRDNGRKERRLVPDPNAPPLWARFYELGTNRPLYLDRDSVFRYDFSEISYERRSGYSYHGTWASSLLASEYPAWRQKHKLP